MEYQGRITLYIFLILSTITLIPPMASGTTEEFATRNTEFALDMLKNMTGLAPGNIIFSPFSVSTALAMTYLGTAGETADEMKEVMGFTGMTSDEIHAGFQEVLQSLDGTDLGVTLSLANKLFADTLMSLKTQYSQDVLTYYSAPVELVDFATSPQDARTTINNFVAVETQQKILDLLGPDTVDSSTVLVLVNAIYFQGNWQTMFDEDETVEDTFYTTSDVSAPVQMMTRKDTYSVGGNTDQTWQILKLPYTSGSNGNVAFYVIKPNSPDNLDDIIQNLDAATINTAIANMVDREGLTLKMPRFTMELEINLSELLMNLNMKKIFSPGADFSALSDMQGLVVDEVVHKAFIEVNEQGTEASAATAVVVGRKMNNFYLNSPFLYFIRDETTGSILFIGRMMAPPSADSPPSVIGRYRGYRVEEGSNEEGSGPGDGGDNTDAASFIQIALPMMFFMLIISFFH